MAKNKISSVGTKFLFGHQQVQILEALNLYGNSFLSDIKQYQLLSKCSNGSLIGTINTLMSRKFINRVKKINPDAKLRVNSNQFWYFLTKQGKEALKSFKNGEYRIKNAPSINKKKERIKIGKNQFVMLNILKEKPLFLTELFPQVKYLNSNIGRIRDGLLRLVKSGILTRKKEFDPNSPPKVKYRNKFSISNKGKILLEKIKKD
ncbi:hypothetical protein LCGC14_1754250 [marine sediment metagenome]|uniref:Uncharacterized protein n=1 Tax=marine sediment metagenome TaxID=412755 RepID=A0A0F9H332_9ZZZZ